MCSLCFGWQGLKYQCGRLWRRTKAHKLQIFVVFAIAAVVMAAQVSGRWTQEGF